MELLDLNQDSFDEVDGTIENYSKKLGRQAPEQEGGKATGIKFMKLMDGTETGVHKSGQEHDGPPPADEQSQQVD